MFKLKYLKKIYLDIKYIILYPKIKILRSIWIYNFLNFCIYLDIKF